MSAREIDERYRLQAKRLVWKDGKLQREVRVALLEAYITGAEDTRRKLLRNLLEQSR